MAATLRKVAGYMTGAASVLDLAGASAPFRALCSHETRPRDPLEALGEDFAAVGSYLEWALLKHAEHLSPEEALTILRALRRIASHHEVANPHDLPWESEQISASDGSTERASGQYVLWEKEPSST